MTDADTIVQTVSKEIPLAGHIDKFQAPYEFIKVPFEVLSGTTSIRVVLTINDTETNAVDLGITGPPTNTKDDEFRGWSGGVRTEFYLATDTATPGYVPGAIHPGQWNVILGPYKSSDNGISWKLQVTLGCEERPLFGPTPATSRVISEDAPRWYRGDMHMHSVYSDGKYTLDELVEHAQKRKLEFVFSTEHNTPSANLVWGKHTKGSMLVGRGEEVTTRKGHWNALGLGTSQWVDFRYKDEQGLKEAVRQVQESEGLAVINHPYDAGLCCDWQWPMLPEFDALEVWNSPWKRNAECQRNIQAVDKWQQLLSEGKRFTAVGGSDAHNPGDVVGLPQTVVFASDLSVSSIIKAIRAGKVYIAAEPNFAVNLELVQGEHKCAGVGETITVEGIWDLSARVHVQGCSGAQVRLISQKGLIEKENVGSDNFKTTFALDPLTVQWVRLEVRNDRDEMLAMSNPVWSVHL